MSYKDKTPEDIVHLNEKARLLLATQISGNSTIFCSLCLSRGEKQSLYSVGDEPWVLYCPHCNVEVNITVMGTAWIFRGFSTIEWQRKLDLMCG